jgi:LemA protein
VNFVTGTVELLIFACVLATVIAFWGYNKLRGHAENVKEALSNISVSTRKKIALINQLMDVAKDYQKSEQLTMLKTSEDLTVSSMQSANQQSGQVLAAINGMAQRFPELKSNQHYNRLMDSIRDSELALEAARTHYNQVAKEYNVLRTSLPHVFYSQLLGFNPAQYLTVEAIESADAGIQQSIVSDDGERVNELLARTGTKVFGAAKNLAEQGRMLAEKGAARIQQRSAEWSGHREVGSATSESANSAKIACQNCGQPMTVGVKFCTNCGAATSGPQVVPPEHRSCSSCGTDNLITSMFCKECGNPLLNETAAS